MRKLLKLVAIGALLAVGPIQAFALVVDDLTPSDAIRFTFPAEILPTDSLLVGTTEFRFFETDTGDQLLTMNAAGEPVLVPVPHDSFMQTIHGTFTLTPGSYFLVLFDSIDLSGEISDVLRLDITFTGSLEGINQYKLNHNFYDAGDPALAAAISGLTCSSIGVSCLSEAGFNTFQDITGPLTGTGISTLFRSDTNLAIPEPEIYAMMGIGLALMGFVARRRKGQNAAAYAAA